MAYYDFKKKPALTTKEGEKDVLYPSIVFNGTINTKQLLKQLVARTGYKPGVVEGTLMELVDLVGEYIGQGYRVEVGEFGYFSGKIKSRLVKDKKDRSWRCGNGCLRRGTLCFGIRKIWRSRKIMAAD